jgi:hypothetical protein
MKVITVWNRKNIFTNQSHFVFWNWYVSYQMPNPIVLFKLLHKCPTLASGWNDTSSKSRNTSLQKLKLALCFQIFGITNTCLTIQKPYIEGAIITSAPWFIWNKNLKHEERQIIFYGHKACVVTLLKIKTKHFTHHLLQPSTLLLVDTRPCRLDQMFSDPRQS